MEHKAQARDTTNWTNYFLLGLLEENKRLRAEADKAESALSRLQSPAQARQDSLREHQGEARHH